MSQVRHTVEVTASYIIYLLMNAYFMLISFGELQARWVAKAPASSIEPWLNLFIYNSVCLVLTTIVTLVTLVSRVRFRYLLGLMLVMILSMFTVNYVVFRWN